MQKLTPEETARVFAMYWGQEIALCSIVNGRLDKRHIGGFPAAPSSKCIQSIELIPLSKITDEHAFDMCGLLGWKLDKNDIAWTLRNEFFNIDYTAYHLLINKGYAVPLFFGINHWANGKTAIELGIAIERN